MPTFAVINGGLGGSALGMTALGYRHLWGSSSSGADGSVYSNLLGTARRFAPVYTLPKDHFEDFFSEMAPSLYPDTLVVHLTPENEACVIAAVNTIKFSRCIVIAKSIHHYAPCVINVAKALSVGRLTGSQRIQPQMFGVPCAQIFSVTRAIGRDEGGLSPIIPTHDRIRRTPTTQSIHRFIERSEVRIGKRITSVEQFLAAQSFPPFEVKRLTYSQKRRIKEKVREEFPPSLMRFIVGGFHSETMSGVKVSWL